MSYLNRTTGVLCERPPGRQTYAVRQIRHILRDDDLLLFTLSLVGLAAVASGVVVWSALR